MKKRKGNNRKQAVSQGKIYGYARSSLTWLTIDKLQRRQASRLRDQLIAEEMFAAIVNEFAMRVDILKYESRYQEHLKLARLTLKRLLNDMRGVSILLHAGYTSQAASVGTSLFENAMLAIALAGNSEHARKFSVEAFGDSPWNVPELCKMAVGVMYGSEGSPEELEYLDNGFYLFYKWMCKLKHPTIQSLEYDAAITKLDTDKDYFFPPIPIAKTEDMAIKQFLFRTCIFYVFGAITSYFLALKPEPYADARQSVQDCYDRKSRIESVFERIGEKLPIEGSIPIKLRDVRIYKKIMAAKARSDDAERKKSEK